VMALLLALAEMFGKSAQTEGISLNIKASDTWNSACQWIVRSWPAPLRARVRALSRRAARSDRAYRYHRPERLRVPEGHCAAT
jgi:hypothetical protein